LYQVPRSAVSFLPFLSKILPALKKPSLVDAGVAHYTHPIFRNQLFRSAGELFSENAIKPGNPEMEVRRLILKRDPSATTRQAGPTTMVSFPGESK
jgi:hypothetical protein